MNQNQVNCAVARATGETVERIRQMGFSLITIHSPPASSQRIGVPFTAASVPGSSKSARYSRRADHGTRG